MDTWLYFSSSLKMAFEIFYPAPPPRGEAFFLLSLQQGLRRQVQSEGSPADALGRQEIPVQELLQNLLADVPPAQARGVWLLCGALVTQPLLLVQTPFLFTCHAFYLSLHLWATSKSPKAFCLVLTNPNNMYRHTHTHTHTAARAGDSMCIRLILSMWNLKWPYIYWPLDGEDKRQESCSSEMKQKAHCIFPY